MRYVCGCQPGLWVWTGPCARAQGVGRGCMSMCMWTGGKGVMAHRGRADSCLCHEESLCFSDPTALGVLGCVYMCGAVVIMGVRPLRLAIEAGWRRCACVNEASMYIFIDVVGKFRGGCILKDGTFARSILRRCGAAGLPCLPVPRQRKHGIQMMCSLRKSRTTLRV